MSVNYGAHEFLNGLCRHCGNPPGQCSSTQCLFHRMVTVHVPTPAQAREFAELAASDPDLVTRLRALAEVPDARSEVWRAACREAVDQIEALAQRSDSAHMTPEELTTQWRRRAAEAEDSAREAEAKNLLVTAAGLMAEAVACREHADEAESRLAAQAEQIAQQQRDIQSLQNLYDGARDCEDAAYGWKERPPGSAAEAVRTLRRRYEQAQAEVESWRARVTAAQALIEGWRTEAEAIVNVKNETTASTLHMCAEELARALAAGSSSREPKE